MKVTHQIPLSGRPNNLAIGRNGSRVYVAIIATPGAVDVIDTRGLKRAKSIATRGGIHNTFVTPDGRHVVAGSIAGRNLTVIDTTADEPIWSLYFDNGVRPIGFERIPTARPAGCSRRSPISTASTSSISSSAARSVA